MSNESSFRWWESYLVRYAIGFIVGVFCVLHIAAKVFPEFRGIVSGQVAAFLGLGAQQASSTTDSMLPTAVTLAGIAYCYIVSAPITVWHGGRMVDVWANRHSVPFWIGWIGLLGVAGSLQLFRPQWLDAVANAHWGFALAIFLGAGSCIIWLSRRYKTLLMLASFDQAPPSDAIACKKVRVYCVLAVCWAVILFGFFSGVVCVTSVKGVILLVLGIPALWMLIDQYAVLAALHMQPEKIIQFYQRLSRARSQDGARDIRDSYTHLREHANAVLIVTAELSLLAFFLWASEQSFWEKRPASTGAIDGSGVWLVMMGCALWLVPATFMWGWANVLERRFAADPESFLPPHGP